MKRVETKDGSVTFFNDKFQETYHSTSGANEEAVKKFVEPCRIVELAKKDKLTILDICFGIGYNSAAAIDTVVSTNPDCQILISAIENDPKIIQKISDVKSTFRSYRIISHLPELEGEPVSISEENIKIDLFIDDARKSIRSLPSDNFEVVFLDPFSPKKCPELWTEEFFKDIFRVMKHKGILATYSCAGSVRRNLKSAGFEVFDGPCVGRRSPSTIAIKN